jgi:hypothetical protein
MVLSMQIVEISVINGPVVTPLRDGTVRLTLPAGSLNFCALTLEEALQLIEDLASVCLLLTYRRAAPVLKDDDA